VNGVRHDLNLESRVTLLDTVRERLNLCGTKKGCDIGSVERVSSKSTDTSSCHASPWRFKPSPLRSLNCLPLRRQRNRR
jgi:hypothetical protein